MTAIPGAGKQDPRTPPPYVDPKDVSAEGPTVTIPRDIFQRAIAASGLPSSSSELRSEGKIIGETQVPHQHKPSPTPAEERLKRIARERARKSNIAYRNRIGMECYKATKQMLFEEITCLEEEKARWKSEAVSLKTALSKAKQPQKEPEVPTRKEVLDLKVCLKQEMEKDELRRFEVKRDASTSYKYLVSELRHIFTQLKNSSFSVGYFDEEGDEVTIATDRELATAFNQMIGPLYKLTINLKKEEDDHPSSVMEDTDEKRRKKKKRAAQAFKEKRDASTTEKVVPHLARQTVSVPAQPPDLLTHSYGPLPGQLRPQLQRRGAQAVEADQRVDVAGARPVRADDAVLRCQERDRPIPPEYWRHPSTRIVKRNLPPRDK